MLFPLALAAALSTTTVPPSDSPIFLMTVDETGRAVCSGPTEQQAIMIWDHLERIREEEALGLDLDYLIDSSDTVTLKFRGVPRAARDAIWYAMDRWYEQLEITIPFTLTIYWEELEEDDDGVAPLGFVRGVWDEEEKEGSWACSERIDWGCHPKTLANQIAGRRLNGTYDSDPEFEIHFNSEATWHTGINGRPGTHEYDLITVTLHEIGHALGFNSGFSINHDRRTGAAAWEGEKWSVYFDQFIWSRGEGELLDLNSSRDLYDALTGNLLYWSRNGMKNWRGETLLSVERNRGAVKMWGSKMTAWGTLVGSGSIAAHMDARVFPNTHIDGLMNPYRDRGQTNRRIGPVTLGMLYDLGWDLKGFNRNPTPPPPPKPKPPPGPTINEDAAEGWAVIRMVGSEEGSRSLPHEAVLLLAQGASFGLFGEDSDLAVDPRFRLLHADPIHSRSTTIHMKAGPKWVPHLVISEKNAPVEGFDQVGLEYQTTVELTGSDFTAFLQTKDQIDLHVHFQGDSRRTVLTFPLRVPIQ